MFDYVPDFMTRRLAASLAGLSDRSFKRRFIDSGLVELGPNELFRAEGTDHVWYVLRYSLEAALGHEITLAEVQDAEARLRTRRRTERRVKRERRRDGR